VHLEWLVCLLFTRVVCITVLHYLTSFAFRAALNKILPFMFSPTACFLVSKFPNITYQEVRKNRWDIYSMLCYAILYCSIHSYRTLFPLILSCSLTYFFLFNDYSFFLDFETSTQHKKYFLIFRFHSLRYSLQNDEYTFQFLTSQILKKVRKKEKKRLKFQLQSTISADNILLWIFDSNYF
jgi:hypothetical protein